MINDSFPAFPMKEPLTCDHYGMTLRDYFAAQVIVQVVGLCSTLDKDAEQAYVIADAMMRAREVQS